MYSRLPLTDYPAPISAWVYGISLQTKNPPSHGLPSFFLFSSAFFLVYFLYCHGWEAVTNEFVQKKLLFVQVSLLV